LLDLITGDAQWADWPGEHLAIALDQGPVLINQVIFSEVSLGFSTIEALEAAPRAIDSCGRTCPGPRLSSQPGSIVRIEPVEAAGLRHCRTSASAPTLR
jgi:hypothetical protein